MEARGMLPSVATNNAVIWNLWDGNMKEINGLLNEMDERKVQADHVTCNALINLYSKKGDMASACKVKRGRMESGLQLDQFTYKAPIHGFCKDTQMDEAKDALFEKLGAGTPSLSFLWF
jgi:pentatricopeptide repeat protein